MNPLDYKADIRVRCLIPTDSNFTQGEIYECFSINPRGTAKVIDDERDENYLLSDEYEIVNEHKFSDLDVDSNTSGYAEYNKDCAEYAVWLQFREPVSFVALTRKDLMYLLKKLEEGEDR